MGFQINERGSREAVMKHIEAFKEAAPDGKVETDQSQANAAKAFAIAEIKALPAEFNGVHVILEGVTHPGARTLNANIMPQKLRL